MYLKKIIKKKKKEKKGKRIEEEENVMGGGGIKERRFLEEKEVIALDKQVALSRFLCLFHFQWGVIIGLYYFH